MSNKIIGVGISSAGLAGDMPQLNRVVGPQYREKRLFFSERDVALIIQKNVVGGFGELEAGQILVGVVGKSNRVVPVGFEVPLAIDAVGAGTGVEVDAKYKDYFKVGDAISIADHKKSTPTAAQHFVIGSIGDGTAATDIKLTFASSASITGTSGSSIFDTDDDAYVMFTVSNGSTVTAPYYVLDQHLDTGDVIKDIGAHTSVVVSNAILYTDALVGSSAAALTGLGAKVDGPFTILK